MISVELNFDDLRLPIEVEHNAAVSIGASSLMLWQHRLLESFIFWNDDTILLVNREIDRWASEESDLVPGTHYVTDKVMQRSRDRFHSSPLSSLVVEISRDVDNPRVSIRTGSTQQSTIFVCASTSKVSLSWSFLNIAKTNRNLIDAQNLSRWLMLRQQAYGTSTIFANIKKIPMDSDALIMRHDIRVTSRNTTKSYAPRELRNDVNLFDIFFNKVTDFIERRVGKHGALACELSGGLDSAVTSVIASTVDRSTVTASIYDRKDKEGLSQMHRQRGVATSLRLPNLSIDVNEHMPYHAGSRRCIGLNVSYFAEPFYEAFYALTSRLKGQGVDVILTGLGGDEAFPVFPTEMRLSGTLTGISRPNKKPSFVTEYASQLSDLAQVIPTHHLPYHASSAQSVDYRTERLFEQGIWALNPYLEPEIIQFTSSLPFELRHERKFLQSILLNNKLHEFAEYKPLSLEPASDRMFETIEDHLMSLLDASESSKLGLVDTEKLKDSYHRSTKCLETLEGRMTSYHIIFFIQMETFLQQCRQNNVLH